MAYDWGNDKIVQTLSLADWESFSEVTDIANGDVSHFSVSSFFFSLGTYVALLTAVTSKQKVNVKCHDEGSMEQPTGHPGPKKPEDAAITFDQAKDAIGIIPFGEHTWQVTAEATMGEETSTIISVVATSPTDPTVRDTSNPAQQ
jgi:hypothetical protein